MRLVAACVLALVISSPLHGDKFVRFADYDWLIRNTREPEGPGPNRFLDNARTVWLDDAGDLHLKVWERNGRWYCAEVRLTEPLGYGIYEFQVRCDAADFDPTVILGMFTFDHDAPDEHYREVDIELGRFGDPTRLPGQFAVQPADVSGNAHRFELPVGEHVATYSFNWTPGQVEFHRDGAAWIYDGPDVPTPGQALVHINLWLYQGRGATRDHEVVITDFSFRPYSE